jgi:hypothetical protein
MRIHRRNFFLTVTLEHAVIGNAMTVEAYGSNFELLPVQKQVKETRETIEIATHMPNTVMLVLSGKTNPNQSIKLVSMSLAGLRFNNNVLPNLVDYKPNLNDLPKNSISELLDNTSMRSMTWDRNGCVLFNLFDPDPFAYHLYVGNKIKF